ncbi:BMP family lipoprotein [Allorhizocola rhizosphaerae]|uniref:BMP family lipoprotein n=1 Tax=Allorhizocola rhizosphaerae TaxID=1872709 RepID=UPI000E3ECBC3|nr:BMP family ABC transporter substrate-binding protein [Allorhizocola rhizosphaerae]
MKIIALTVAGGLTVAAAACSQPPADTGPGGTTTSFSTCMVTDIGGIDDRSFNASAWAGLEAAKGANSAISTKYVASKSEADYEPNLQGYVSQNCDFILAVGGLMFDSTKKVAAANPTKQFAIVDANVGQPNVFPMQFDTAQAAFLAGYLAAGYSKTGKVATYGGLKIPPVTIFMDGFVDGVAHYNKTKSKNVEVLGWNKATQDGAFAASFTDQAKGKALSDTFIAQGADVIMPVAGGAGLGTASAAAGKYAVIWVDVDGCKSAQQYCSAFLTTVVKNMTDAVRDAAVKAAGQKGTLVTGGFLGTLANNGVSLAPYNEFDSKIDAALKSEVDALKQEIISGKITVTSPAQPK